jgi:hypothetical protein
MQRTHPVMILNGMLKGRHAMNHAKYSRSILLPDFSEGCVGRFLAVEEDLDSEPSSIKVASFADANLREPMGLGETSPVDDEHVLSG